MTTGRINQVVERILFFSFVHSFIQRDRYSIAVLYYRLCLDDAKAVSFSISFSLSFLTSNTLTRFPRYYRDILTFSPSKTNEGIFLLYLRDKRQRSHLSLIDWLEKGFFRPNSSPDLRKLRPACRTRHDDETRVSLAFPVVAIRQACRKRLTFSQSAVLTFRTTVETDVNSFYSSIPLIRQFLLFVNSVQDGSHRLIL